MQSASKELLRYLLMRKRKEEPDMTARMRSQKKAGRKSGYLPAEFMQCLTTWRSQPSASVRINGIASG